MSGELSVNQARDPRRASALRFARARLWAQLFEHHLAGRVWDRCPEYTILAEEIGFPRLQRLFAEAQARVLEGASAGHPRDRGFWNEAWKLGLEKGE